MRILFLALSLMALAATQAVAMQTLQWNGREIGGWICVVNELKPKTGANSSNTWILQGNEIRPKFGASSSNTWIRAGNEIRPKLGPIAVIPGYLPEIR